MGFATLIPSWLRKPQWRGIGLGLCCAVAWLVVRQPLVQGLEEWCQDGFFSLRGKRPTRARVILIGLDDPSLDDLRRPLLYTSPEIAEVVTFLKEQNVAAIGLDVLVPHTLTGASFLTEPSLMQSRYVAMAALARAFLYAGHLGRGLQSVVGGRPGDGRLDGGLLRADAPGRLGGGGVAGGTAGHDPVG
jgi:hypothetical protein